jgi:Fe-S-cluster containining protein
MFPCTSCGVCCQNISHIKELNGYALDNGICKYFDSHINGCKIYDTRPDICQVDKMFELKYHKEFTKEEFYRLNAEACNRMQGVYNIDKNFRVKIGE